MADVPLFSKWLHQGAESMTHPHVPNEKQRPIAYAPKKEATQETSAEYWARTIAVRQVEHKKYMESKA